MFSISDLVIIAAPVSKNLFSGMLIVSGGGSTGSTAADNQLKNAIQIAKAIPFSTPMAGELGSRPATIFELIERSAGGQNSLKKQVLDRLRNQNLWQAINQLSEREQQIIVDRFYKGRTLDDTADDLPGGRITRERVRQLEKKALKKLRSFLHDFI